jgi:hypothetical protein
LLEILSVKIVGKNDIKRILKIEAENDFVGRLTGTNIFTKIEYLSNKIKELYPYFIEITGVKYT